MQQDRQRLGELRRALEERHVPASVESAVVFAVDGDEAAEVRGFLVSGGYFEQVEQGVFALAAELVVAGAVVDEQRDDGVVLEGEVGEAAEVREARESVPAQQTGSGEASGEERA